MADSREHWSMMGTERCGAGGSESCWPRCVLGSGLAHVLLLGVCLLTQPVSEQARQTLRVRLIEETPVAAPNLDAAEAVRVTIPARVMTPRTLRRSSSRSRPAVVAVPPAPAPLAEPAPEPPAAPGPLPHSPPPAVVEPPPPAATAPVAPPIIPLSGQSRAEPSVGAVDARGDAESFSSPRAGGGDELAPPQASASGTRGTFLISEPGNGRGLGTGSATGAGWGATADQKTGGGWGDGVRSGGGSSDAPGTLARGRGGAASNGRDRAELLRIIASQIARVWTYPDEARREGLQGTVELRFRVAADGSIETVEVVRSSGHAVLDDAAIRALRKGGPYPVYGGWLRYPFTYRLDR